MHVYIRSTAVKVKKAIEVQNKDSQHTKWHILPKK